MSISLPPSYHLEGSVEGKRTLYENTPVYRIVPGGLGAVRWPQRRVANFQKTAKKRDIESVAELDYESRHPSVTEIDRQDLLRELAEIFRRKL